MRTFFISIAILAAVICALAYFGDASVISAGALLTAIFTAGWAVWGAEANENLPVFVPRFVCLNEIKDGMVPVDFQKGDTYTFAKLELTNRGASVSGLKLGSKGRRRVSCSAIEIQAGETIEVRVYPEPNTGHPETIEFSMEYRTNRRKRRAVFSYTNEPRRFVQLK